MIYNLKENKMSLDKYAINYWLNCEDDYFDYWNNEEFEKDKEWYVLDGNFLKLEKHLEKTGLIDELLKYSNYMKGNGIDLAAGNLWAAPHILKYAEKLYCIDYSKHRISKIGPVLLEHYNVLPEKIVVVCGSFYDLKIENNSLDFAFLSQALHHAEKPDKLLSEIYRVLKPDGVVLIIGEEVINELLFILSQFIKKLKGCKLVDVLGDHHYTSNQYRKMFLNAKFEIIKDDKGKSNRAFVLKKIVSK